MTNGSEPIPAAPVQEKAPVALEIGAVLLLTLATFLSFLTGAADAGDLAELIGAGMAPTIVALIVLALFRLAGKAGSRRSVATISFWTLLVVCIGTCAGMVVPVRRSDRSEARPKLTAADGQPPVMIRTRGGTVLCQQSLGIEVDDGGIGLTAAPDLDAQVGSMLADAGLAGWVYREPGGGIVLITGSRGFDSREALQHLVIGFSKMAAGTAQITGTSQQVEWHDRAGVAVMAARLKDDRQMVTRCVTSPSGILGCVQTIASDPARLERLRDSVTASGCSGP